MKTYGSFAVVVSILALLVILVIPPPTQACNYGNVSAAFVVPTFVTSFAVVAPVVATQVVATPTVVATPAVYGGSFSSVVVRSRSFVTPFVATSVVTPSVVVNNVNNGRFRQRSRTVIKTRSR